MRDLLLRELGSPGVMVDMDRECIGAESRGNLTLPVVDEGRQHTLLVWPCW